MHTTSVGKLDFDQFWGLNYHLKNQVFRVQAARDANLLLATDLGKTIEDTYLVTIGENQNERASIMKDGVAKEISNDDGLMSGSEMRTFWLSWEMGEIEMGRGRQIGLDRVIHWQDPEPHPVHALSISTVDDIPGRWEFYQLHGK